VFTIASEMAGVELTSAPQEGSTLLSGTSAAAKVVFSVWLSLHALCTALFLGIYTNSVVRYFLQTDSMLLRRTSVLQLCLFLSC
jgi:hypothetical protein